ncbi:alanine racemase [Labilibaculum filiforme]|uniref:Alanine racemase n=1 Tax=Labilibaculum filiforme TaxID=1940526 RepID=A0A2N3I0N6_9BACT|nr:alanine racemase [Labilibaculum filiforme]PKQ63827.1 alanine racemase [Labilibaculum filiforme]
MTEGSVISIDEKSLQKNVTFLKKKMGKNVCISAVVKANAYGHGIEQIVPLFEKHGINHYSVFSYEEAIRVYVSLSGANTIMIMGWIADEDMPDVIEKGIEFFIFNIERLQVAIAYAKELNIKANIHLEAETGMNRSGLNAEELAIAISIIKENDAFINVVGFCTHLAGAESISNHPRIQKQLKNYNKMLSILEASNIHPKCKHVANSAASFIYPKARMDMVRIGIMLYGFWSSTEVFIQYFNNKANKQDPLERILSWKSQIMSIKEVKCGEFVSYGISYLAQSNIKTALIPIGYASGYSRSLSNKGIVLIHGHRCGVIGVVNMNMIIADISNVPSTEVGDEVVIIGKQDDLEIKVSAFSDISDQLNYEVLAHLSELIERKVIVKE